MQGSEHRGDTDLCSRKISLWLGWRMGWEGVDWKEAGVAVESGDAEAEPAETERWGEEVSDPKAV